MKRKFKILGIAVVATAIFVLVFLAIIVATISFSSIPNTANQNKIQTDNLSSSNQNDINNIDLTKNGYATVMVVCNFGEQVFCGEININYLTNSWNFNKIETAEKNYKGRNRSAEEIYNGFGATAVFEAYSKQQNLTRKYFLEINEKSFAKIADRMDGIIYNKTDTESQKIVGFVAAEEIKESDNFEKFFSQIIETFFDRDKDFKMSTFLFVANNCNTNISYPVFYDNLPNLDKIQ